MSKDNTVEGIARRWLRDQETPSEELDLGEAVRRAQAFTDGETLVEPMSLSEIVALMMKTIDMTTQYLYAIMMSSVAKVEGWDGDQERMEAELVSGWASLDLLRTEATIEILEQRGPRAHPDGGNQSSSEVE